VFLRRLDREFPGGVKLRLVMDGYGTHKTDEVRRQWLQKHPRFVCHFIPTSSSWLNLLERCFGGLSQKAIKRGCFGSVPDLKMAIDEFRAAWNEKAQPFIWTAPRKPIMKTIARAREKLESIKPGSWLPRGKT
jgi:transposase